MTAAPILRLTAQKASFKLNDLHKCANLALSNIILTWVTFDLLLQFKTECENFLVG